MSGYERSLRRVDVQVGLLEADMRGERRRALDVAQGALPRQRPDRGVLRDPEGGVLQRADWSRAGFGEFRERLEAYLR